MPDHPPAQVALLRPPGGEPWEDARAQILEWATHRLEWLEASRREFGEWVLAGRPVVVTSPRAARWIAELGPDTPRGTVHVSGSRTARILAAAGWNPVPPLEGSGGAAIAGRLLRESPGLGGVLYVCGQETAGTLESTFDRAGVDVRHFEVYRLEPSLRLSSRDREVLRGSRAIAFMAPSCVEALRTSDPSFFRILAETLPALSGPTTARTLRRLGWKDVRTAPEPSCSALIDRIFPPNGDIMTSSAEWFARSSAVTPGGVHSPVRAFRHVGAAPFYVASAEGARLKTVEGAELLDWVGSWGPMIQGHNPGFVVEAIAKALSGGTSFGACSLPEVELSEEIVARVPGVEKVRLVNSGTEATMSAVRLARGATGRDVIVKFRGCYHGHGDSFLVAAGSGALTHGSPSSPGVTASTARDTLIAEFNELESVETLFRQRKGEIAAVIVEPVPGNMGVVPPRPGFLEDLQRICRNEGALLILDEVMTGFRLARGGASERLGMVGDLVTLGKIAGGGLPLAAFAGRADVMDRLSPLGPVYQAGTLSGNPLACAAGLALLRSLDQSVYQRLEALGERLERGLAEGEFGRNPAVRLQRVGSMATVFFHRGPVETFDQVLECDTDAYAAFFRGMLAKGHFLPPAQFEAFFLSTAHTEADIDRFVSDAGEVVADLGNS